MELRTVSAIVLLSAGLVAMASGTQSERPILRGPRAQAAAALENEYTNHKDPVSLSKLSQAYLEAEMPGLAVSAIENSPAKIQRTPVVQHAYARALLDSGRAESALAAEHRTIDMCASLSESKSEKPCDAYLIASATRRADIIEQLALLGVEDTQAHPEASAIAYHNATREAHLAIQ